MRDLGDVLSLLPCAPTFVASSCLLVSPVLQLMIEVEDSVGRARGQAWRSG